MLGLASRTNTAHNHLPTFVTQFAGDTLWAFMVYWMFAAAFVNWRPPRSAALASCFSVCIEFSQTIIADWLETIRNLPGMRLVLGYGFLWSDVVCYTVGVLVACLADHAILTARRAVDPADFDRT